MIRFDWVCMSSLNLLMKLVVFHLKEWNIENISVMKKSVIISFIGYVRGNGSVEKLLEEFRNDENIIEVKTFRTDYDRVDIVVSIKHDN